MEYHTITLTFTPTSTMEYETIVITKKLRVVRCPVGIVWEYEDVEELLKNEALNEKQLTATIGKYTSTRIYHSSSSIMILAFSPLYNWSFISSKWRKRYNDIIISLEFIVSPKIDPGVLWSNNKGDLRWDEITYGDKLSKKQLNASCEIDGTFEYVPSLGSILEASQSTSITVIFTPHNTGKITYSRRFSIRLGLR